MKFLVWPCLIAFAALGVVGLGVWNNEKVRDDLIFFRADQDDVSLSALKELWSQAYFHELGHRDTTYYRPLSRVAYRLENRLFNASLPALHFVAMAGFAFLLALIWRLLQRWSLPPTAAALVTLLVGLHPLSHSFWVYMTGVVDTLPALALVGATLLVQKSGRSYLWAAIAVLFVGQFSKEYAVLGWLVVALDLWRQQRKSDLKLFLPAAVVGAGVFFYLRSSVVGSPPLLLMLQDGRLLLAWLRESLWSPLRVLARPDLCQQSRHVLLDVTAGGWLLALTVSFWVAVCLRFVREKKSLLWQLVVVFWAFWSLSLANARVSRELFDEAGVNVSMMYVPDHLLFFPILILVGMLTRWCWAHRAFRVALLLATLATATISAVKTEEWQDEKTLLQAVVAGEPSISREYSDLARLHINSGEWREAYEVLQRAAGRGFKEPRLYRMLALAARHSGESDWMRYYDQSRVLAVETAKLDLAMLSRTPRGREMSIRYLEEMRQHYPREPWFAERLEELWR